MHSPNPSSPDHVQTVADKSTVKTADKKVASTDKVLFELIGQPQGGANHPLANAYNNTISELRRRVTDGTFREGILRERTAEQFFSVNLVAPDHPQVRLVFNTANLYVVGYETGGRYTRFGDEGPSDPFNLGASHVRSSFLRQGDYTYLERQGAVRFPGGFDRGSQGLGAQGMWRAFETLANPNADVPASARAITLFIQALAEGARFDFMSTNIGQAMRDGDEFTSGSHRPVSGNGGVGGPLHQVTGIDFQNNWSQISRAIINWGNTGAIRIVVGSVVFTTIAALATQIAVIDMNPKG
nr:ribosome-inactivating family protein [Streptomyces sp. SID13726]